MEMFSLFKSRMIQDTLDEIFESRANWTIWQPSTQGKVKISGVITMVDEQNLTMDITEGDPGEIKASEPIYAHCPQKDVIFKRETFQLKSKTLTFKTPNELKLRERRRVERFTYKYQDFKTVSLKFYNDKEGKGHSFTLNDLSTSGLSFVCPKSELPNVENGTELFITHISDQEMPEDHHCKVVYISRFMLPEGVQDRTNANELVKVGVDFLQSLESVTYKSISSIVAKKQERTRGLDVDSFKGLMDDEQQRVLNKIAEDNQALASNIRDRIEEIDSLRFMTPQMKQTFWLEVNQDLLAAALRLSSRELIYDLLIDVTDRVREEFLFKLDDAKAPSAINKAQDSICEFIRAKVKSGEFVLSPTSFVKYV
ncbi:MAG: hypothetical protein GY909_09935 [Oligoflexia bacterium]|nr:hypothetical protein [Oligoflexia bacterium]